MSRGKRILACQRTIHGFCEFQGPPQIIHPCPVPLNRLFHGHQLPDHGPEYAELNQGKGLVQPEDLVFTEDHQRQQIRVSVPDIEFAGPELSNGCRIGIEMPNRRPTRQWVLKNVFAKVKCPPGP